MIVHSSEQTNKCIVRMHSSCAAMHAAPHEQPDCAEDHRQHERGGGRVVVHCVQKYGDISEDR